MSQYFNRGSPVVTTSVEFGSDSTQFNLYHEQLFLPFSLARGADTVPPAKSNKWITIVANVEELKYNFTTNKFDKRLVKQIPFAPCPEIDDEVVNKVLFGVAELDELQEILICPDFSVGVEEYLVKRDVSENHLKRRITVKVYPCSLPDPATQCATPMEMIALALQHPIRTRLLVPSNYEDPVRDMFAVAIVKIDPHATKSLQHIIKSNKILDDTVQLVKPYVRKEYGSPHILKNDFTMRNATQLYCQKEWIERGEGGGCQEYIEFAYELSGEVVVTRRNYKKFTTMLGEFGGILKILTTVVFFAYSFYNFRQVKRFLRLEMMNLNKNSYKDVKGLLKGYMDAERNKNNKNNSYISNDSAKKKGITEKRQNRPRKTRNEYRVLTKDEYCAKRCDQLLDKHLESRSNVVDLMGKLNLLEFIEQNLLEEHERKLLPLVLLASRKIKRKQKEKENNKNSNNNINNEDYGIQKELRGNTETRQRARSANNFGFRRGSISAQSSCNRAYEDSYRQILSQKPKNVMNESLRRYIVDCLEGRVFNENDLIMMPGGDQSRFKASITNKLGSEMRAR